MRRGVRASVVDAGDATAGRTGKGASERRMDLLQIRVEKADTDT
jgi:hypothetical protein